MKKHPIKERVAFENYWGLVSNMSDIVTLLGACRVSFMTHTYQYVSDKILEVDYKTGTQT